MTTESLGYSEPDIASALDQWWDEEVESTSDPFAKKPSSGTIMDAAPAVDSLMVLDAILRIEKIVPFKVPECTVQRGGYQSKELMIKDILPKIRDLAAKAQSKGAKPSATKTGSEVHP